MMDNIIYRPGHRLIGSAPYENSAKDMKIHLETGAGANIIRSYGAGKITVNQQTYTASLIIMPDKIVDFWGPKSAAELDLKDFQRIADLQPEVVVLGTGSRLRFPAPAATQPLVQARIGLEVMDTAAACRTYNILMGEGRRVAAALLMIES